MMTSFDVYPSPPSNLVVEMYNSLLRDGNLKTVFYDVDVASEEKFLSYFDEPGRFLFPIVLDGVPQGAGWIDTLEARSARIHFFTLKECYGSGKSVPATRACLKYISQLVREDMTPMFDCIWGFTPAANKLALRFIKRVGMEVIGTLPCGAYIDELGKSVDVVVSHLNLERARNANEHYVIRSSSFPCR